MTLALFLVVLSMLDSKFTSIDSLQLRIDLSFVKFTPEGERLLLNEYFLTNSQTGEIAEDTLKKYAYTHKEKGITSRFLVRKAGYNQKENSASSQDLEMILNSKMLKSKYIYGINKNTIKCIYRYIMSLGLFTISMKNLLTHSRCTDIDIKTDLHNFSTEKTLNFFTGLNVVAPTQALSLNPEKELIIQYGYRRNDKKVKTNPFIKLYHKMVELRYNSLEFYKEHLKPIYGASHAEDNHLNDICRIEGQIKDKTHYRSLLKLIDLPEKDNSLFELLTLTESNLKSIISIFLNKQIKVSDKVTTMERIQGQNSNLSMQDKAYISAIKLEILEGGSIETFIFNNCQSISRNSRYTYKKKFNDLYKSYLIDDNEVTQKNEFKGLLNSILNLN